MARLIESVQGHATQWDRLMEALRGDRLAHALAFVGPAGIGKRRVAMAVAQAGVCRLPSAPCGICGDCTRVASQQHESVQFVQPIGAALKIEQAHAILEFLSLRSLSKRRFVIIDEAAQMNAAFGNALLKILEEPPADVHFIFVLPALSQLLTTIRSRLQAVRFFPLEDSVLAATGAAPWMVTAAAGSFQRLEQWQNPSAVELKAQAISALSELAASGRGREKIEELLEKVKDRDTAEVTSTFFQQFLRDAYVRKTMSAPVVHADCESALAAWSKFERAQILSLWNEAHRLRGDIDANLDRVLSFEVFFQRGEKQLS